MSTDKANKSKVSIETFSVDTSIGESAEQFEQKLKSGDLASICESKIQDAKTDEEKSDWQVIETLNAGKSRKKLRKHMGFADEVDACCVAEAPPERGVDFDGGVEAQAVDAVGGDCVCDPGVPLVCDGGVFGAQVRQGDGGVARPALLEWVVLAMLVKSMGQ